jgi:hypothetical protein
MEHPWIKQYVKKWHLRNVQQISFVIFRQLQPATVPHFFCPQGGKESLVHWTLEVPASIRKDSVLVGTRASMLDQRQAAEPLDAPVLQAARAKVTLDVGASLLHLTGVPSTSSAGRHDQKTDQWNGAWAKKEEVRTLTAAWKLGG